MKDRNGMFRTILLGMGVASLFWGMIRGEAGTVLTKAIYVCLECIGIG